MSSDRDAGGPGPGEWLAPESDDLEDAYGDLDYNDPYEIESDGRTGVWAQPLLKVGVAVVAVAIFVGVIWYAYGWGTQQGGDSQALPVVRAGDGPEKVRPEDPGGMEVPHQDKLVLNESGGNGGQGNVERLLPPPETPQPPPAEQTGAQTTSTSAATSNGVSGQTATAGSASTPERESPDGTARQSGQVAQVPEADMPDMPPAPSESEAAGGTGTNAAKIEDDSRESETVSSDAGGTKRASDDSAADGGEPEPRDTATGSGSSSTKTASLASGDVAIQLAALQSESAARRAWGQLQGKHAGLLSDQRLSLQRVSIEGKGTFWRVRTGPFPNRATAEDMCAQLEARGQDCLVVKE